jgi:sugar lactone lactonase YvrE
MLVILTCQLGAQVITTIAGTYWSFPPTPIPATKAPLQLFLAHGLAADDLGNLYIADGGRGPNFGNNLLMRISPDGSLTIIGGNGIYGFSGDGGQATNAALSNPDGLAVDRAGNVFFIDFDMCRVRKITTDGVISTVAGTGNCEHSGAGGVGTNLALAFPQGLAVDPNGNLFIADTDSSRVRRLSPSGIVTTIAGNGTCGFLGDGGFATSAQLCNPSSLVLDSSGNLFVSDQGNHRVRKISPAGIITTAAGNGTDSAPVYDRAPALSAPLTLPDGLAIDSAGNLFVAERTYRLVYKLTPNGILTRFAGKLSEPGLAGDGGPATERRARNTSWFGCRSQWQRVYSGLGKLTRPPSRYSGGHFDSCR